MNRRESIKRAVAIFAGLGASTGAALGVGVPGRGPARSSYVCIKVVTGAVERHKGHLTVKVNIEDVRMFDQEPAESSKWTCIGTVEYPDNAASRKAIDEKMAELRTRLRQGIKTQ